MTPTAYEAMIALRRHAEAGKRERCRRRCG